VKGEWGGGWGPRRRKSSRAMIVTGAGSGIGAAVAERAAADGWRVTICGRRPGPLAGVAARTGARPVTADVTDPADVQALVEGTVAADGRLDCVVANAGVMRSGSVLDLDPADWELTLRTNLTSAYLLARAALPHLLAGAGLEGEEGWPAARGGRPAAPGGSLVAVSSIAALRASSAAAAYAVSKAGLVMLMQSLAADFGPAGLRANVVCPGWVRTEMADQEMTEFGAPLGLDRDTAYREVTRLVPQRRPAEPAEIAAAVTWLAGPDASYVNGACLVVDGGTVLVDPGTVGLDFSISDRTPPG
jgi:meso-butanediol dehydrogenase / (S,S)-butanediol dehydrogenase / diacetyl reductase